jgi:hypothetical protein
LDCYGDHALSCTCCGLYSRHNKLRDVIVDEYMASGLSVRVEAKLPGCSSRPADVLVLDSSDPFSLAVDVSVVHPLYPSSAAVEVTPGASAAVTEESKIASAGQTCAAEGWRLLPLCAEPTGAWGPTGQKCVRGLIRKLSMRLVELLQDTAVVVWRRLLKGQRGCCSEPTLTFLARRSARQAPRAHVT